MAIIAWTKLAAAIWITATQTDKADIRQYGLENQAALDSALSASALIGGYFEASVNANVLTIAVKNVDGNDPTSAKPVYVDLRSVTQAAGATQRRALTAALSLTVSAGSTLGFTNGVHGRLWVVLFDDGGTLRLGVINCNVAGFIYPLYPSLVTSSTAEGGAGAADSAGVLYTGAAVTSKAFVVLGHMTWETALATAGNWATAPDVVHQQRFGDLLPGDLVQRPQSVDGASATTTTTTPFDNTIPQAAEGGLFMTQAITPKSKANVLEVAHEGTYAASVAGHVTVSIHQDAGVSLAARGQKVSAGGDMQVIVVSKRLLAATVSSTSFTVRAGLSTAGTVTFNGSAGAGIYGGVNLSRLEVSERMG